MQNKKTRIRYSKEFKRKALLEVMQGKKPLDVFLNSGFDLSEVLEKDKKYANKLISKWKQEIYQNNEMLNLLNTDLDNVSIEKELENLKDDNEKDLIFNKVMS